MHGIVGDHGARINTMTTLHIYKWSANNVADANETCLGMKHGTTIYSHKRIDNDP